MRLRWWDRLLMVLGGLALIITGAALILAGTGLLSRIFPQTQALDTWLGDAWKWMPIVIAIGAVLVLLGLWMLLRAFRRGEGGKYYTLQTEKDGNVRISVHAIDNLVNKSLNRYQQVASAKIRIGGSEDAMDITLHMTLVSDVNIPSLVDEIREDIKQTLQGSAGVTVQTVQVYVDATRDDKDKEDVRYIEGGKKSAPVSAPREEAEDFINTASFYTTPVVVTGDNKPEEPIDAQEPNIEELKKEVDLGPDESLPVDLSGQAFPFPEKEAGVPLQIFTEDVPIPEDQEDDADE